MFQFNFKTSRLTLTFLLFLFAGSLGAQNNWQAAYPLSELTPKRKLGGLVRFNDPSFFYAEEERLVTNQGRYKRHRTFLFPHLPMTHYPYKLRVTMRKRDNHPVSAGLIFGAKTVYEFESGSANSHGALFAYVSNQRLEFRDHRTYDTGVWQNASTELSGQWDLGETITLEIQFTDKSPYGSVSAQVGGAVSASLPSTPIDLGKPDEYTNQPHIRGQGYFGFSVDGPGEVEILDLSVAPGHNPPITEGLDAYARACEWAVIKETRSDYFNLTFALREAGLTGVSLRQNDNWGPADWIPATAKEREGGHTIYTHRIQWTGTRPDRYRLMQNEAIIYEGRVPPNLDQWPGNRPVVGLAVSCNGSWRYKQQNQRNWFDHVLSQVQIIPDLQGLWVGDPPKTFAKAGEGHVLGYNATEYLKYQGNGYDWPDFLFAGDDYPAYPDNPILPLSELDYQQRIFDVLALTDSMYELHGNLPSAFKGGDHEFANSEPLQPGGIRGENYPGYLKRAYRAVALEGYEPIHPDELSYISRPVPGWIEVFHMVTRYNQTIATNSTTFPQQVDKSHAQSPSGLYVMEKLEEWARSSPAPFKIVHQDHPLGDIRDVSQVETYSMYPWERGAMIRLIAETGLIYVIGDEHNLRLVRYTDFSNASPEDPRLAPLKDMSIYELGISNLSGEWFRHVLEDGFSLDGFEYDLLHQSVPETGLSHVPGGFQERNGYTVMRFHKDARNFDFEIWNRNGPGAQSPAKDPRKESPNFQYNITPKDIYWKSSMLPDIDLTDHGIPESDAANLAYSIKTSDGTLLYTNRADSKGLIRDMPCPTAIPGTPISLETINGKTIKLVTMTND